MRLRDNTHLRLRSVTDTSDPGLSAGQYWISGREELETYVVEGNISVLVDNKPLIPSNWHFS